MIPSIEVVMPRASHRSRRGALLLLVASAWFSQLGCADPRPSADEIRVASLPSPILPDPPYSYADSLPAHFQTATVARYDNTPADDPTTDAGATLGRVLFHDRRLSRNGTVACASCHQQSHGFSDPRAASVGFEGGTTSRHAMPIHDVRFYERGRCFWDERAATVEAQVLMPIESDVEMGMTLDALVRRLESTEYYPSLFEAAFGDPGIDSDRIARALAQFVRSIVSYRSRWDRAMAQVTTIEGDLPGFTAEENRGKAIFFGEYDASKHGLCGTCHMRDNELATAPPGVTLPTPANAAIFLGIGPTVNGLPDPNDLGVGGISGRLVDDGRFKAPSLRNVALRAPYMHDGRFATLDEVVAFYDHGIAPVANLDPVLRGPDGGPIRLGLSDSDRAALVAFLGTLTDDALVADPRFSDPFPAP